MGSELEPFQRLQRDVAAMANTMTTAEIRYLVDGYYGLQEYRKAAANQERAMGKAGEAHEVISWFRNQAETLEAQIKRVLDRWTDSNGPAVWAKSICGVGPVISAGLAAHIDIQKAPTAGHIWRYAGLDPTREWGKGEKRPWNASLRTLCWKIGESFVKVSTNQNDVYGKVYLRRKAEEEARNETLDYSAQAKTKLERFQIGKDKKARAIYESGKLPPAHIHSRAKRYAVKLFLSHYHEVAYTMHFGEKPPRPWVIEHGGHAHFIAPPNWPLPQE